jgi:hypothetical protein
MAEVPEQVSEQADDSEGSDLWNYGSSRFKVYNRVVATRPVDHVLSLINLPNDQPGLMPPPATAHGLDAESDDDQDEGAAYFQILSMHQPDAIGVRLAMHVQTEDHLFIVDAAVEYGWKTPPAYGRQGFEEFILIEAAPWVSIATWTLMEEMARSVEGALDPHIRPPESLITENVMRQFDRSQEREAKAATRRRTARAQAKAKAKAKR